MPRLKNRLHERFCWLMAEGMEKKAAYAKLCPHVSNPAHQGWALYQRDDIKCRVNEIQNEVHSRAVMALDEKRDLLRQMIEGTVPTKVVRGETGRLTATFDRIAALKLDLEVAGELRQEQLDSTTNLALTFEMYDRNDQFAPKQWIEAELVREEDITPPIEIGGPDLSQYSEAEIKEDQPDLNSMRKASFTSNADSTT